MNATENVAGNATKKRATKASIPACGKMQTDQPSFLASSARRDKRRLACGLAATNVAKLRSPLRNSA